MMISRIPIQFRSKQPRINIHLPRQILNLLIIPFIWSKKAACIRLLNRDVGCVQTSPSDIQSSATISLVGIFLIRRPDYDYVLDSVLRFWHRFNVLKNSLMSRDILFIFPEYEFRHLFIKGYGMTKTTCM